MFLVNIKIKYQFDLRAGAIPVLFLYLENPALDVGFQNAYSYGGNKKTPSDIIKDAVWQLHFNIRRRTFR